MENNNMTEPPRAETFEKGESVYEEAMAIKKLENNMDPVLRIGDKAPDFAAQTTFGNMNLSDYKGKWLILFSHPR